MNIGAAILILVLLLLGPLAAGFIERNLEAYIFALGIVATLVGPGFQRDLVLKAAREPALITIAVIVAGVLFGLMRERMDSYFDRLRRRVSRPVLTAGSIFVLALLSSVITVIIAALMLVEVIGLLRLRGQARVRVAVSGCFAIGLATALTPLGGPLSTLAASSLKLPFFGLFELLGPWILPRAAGASILAGYFARGAHHETPQGIQVRESTYGVLLQGGKVYVFIAGLVLVSHAYEPVVTRFVQALSNNSLFWMNTISAVLDNATLVSLEVHDMTPPRARAAIIALLVSGGMLIPGNIPNIVSAGPLKIGSTAWARIGVPIGLIGLGLYFFALRALA
jgi:predicted cation transporter